MLGNQIKALQEKVTETYWSHRILSQVNYLYRVSEYNDQKIHGALHEVVKLLELQVEEDSVITKELAKRCENQLAAFTKDAKSYKIICVAHAHIDMNWMWGWDETVSVTLDTMRTMLDLMKEYPDFTFAQSQASIYKIIEDYAPEMLDEIKARVREGRFEVTASHWVEADKNMPNGESLSRHILYTKQYLSQLLDIDPESLNIDFEPDTFGHSINVPEILVNGGVKYYYHCRGYEGYNLYRWSAPSGQSVIVYREPVWYNGDIDASMALNVPPFCDLHNHKTMLKVYGVGDHGGGPTRRDIERIMDMNTWPIFPQLVFGTYQEYFKEVERIADDLPEVKGELNSIFTGCYTSQSRIKMANRLSEQTLDEAEKFSSIAALMGKRKYPHKALSDAWKNTLFSQFHDILPGSGVTETREYAMGSFQNIMATANSLRSLALKSIAGQINTSRFFSEVDEGFGESTSEGAGVGYGSNKFQVFQAERGRGLTRVFHVFNSSMQERRENVEITVWDWQGNTNEIIFQDELGQLVSHQLLEKGFNHYWGHHFMKVLIEVQVPSFGYKTYVMKQQIKASRNELIEPLGPQPRVEPIEAFVLENDHLKATFNSKNASLISLIDKHNKKELVGKNFEYGTGGFRYIEEDDDKHMTAWIVGRYMNVEPINENVKITKLENNPASLRQCLEYHVSFKHSSLKVNIMLNNGSKQLDFNVECDWQEHGKTGKFIPQLNYYLPVSFPVSTYKYDVPMGVIERPAKEQDAAGNSFIAACQEDENETALMLVAKSKYGFRGNDRSLSVSLIRGSYDPDPYPELGIHQFSFALCLVNGSRNATLLNESEVYRHPLNAFSGKNQANGTLEPNGEFMKLETGNVSISGIKQAENPVEAGIKEAYIVRLFETEGQITSVKLRFFKKIKRAYFVDINENEIAGDVEVVNDGKCFKFDVKPFTVTTICFEVD